MTLPDYAIDRTIVVPDLASPVDAHAPFVIRTNVATDTFAHAAVELFAGPNTTCREAYPLDGTGSISVDLLAMWMCPVLGAGEMHAYELEADLRNITGQLGACEGTLLACDPPVVGQDAFAIDASVTLVF